MKKICLKKCSSIIFGNFERQEVFRKKNSRKITLFVNKIFREWLCEVFSFRQKNINSCYLRLKLATTQSKNIVLSNREIRLLR
jgi:hypothetical protein